MRLLSNLITTAFLFHWGKTAAAASDPFVGVCSTVKQGHDFGPIQLGFTSVLDNDVGPNGYLYVSVVYAGIGWIAWGFSETGSMAPGYSVVGTLGNLPVIYNMTSKSVGGLLPLDSSKQTLGKSFFNQNGTHTMMSFSKRLIEDQEQAIVGQGPNNFLVAWGNDNTFSYHGPSNRQKLPFTLEACKSTPPTATPAAATATSAPTAAPVILQPTPAAVTAQPSTTGGTAPPAAATATSAPTAAPVILQPTPAVVAAQPLTTDGTQRIYGDCSKFQQKFQRGPLKVAFTTILDNDIGPNGYLRAQILYVGAGWIAWGHSQNGKMIPGFGVLGIPPYAPVKVALMDKTQNGVQRMDSHSLQGATLTQNGTHTILRFTKRLIEDGELAINGEGNNNFLFAWGANNTFGYHGPRSKMAVNFDLRACISNQTTPTVSPITPSPTAPSPPAIVPTAPATSKITGDCSKLQQKVNHGPLQIGFTSIMDEDGLNGYLHVRVIYAGHGWVAWGYSQNGTMVPGYGVLGAPNFIPTKINMTAKSLDGVRPLDTMYQTLKDVKLTQNATHTSLEFYKRLVEFDEPPINGHGSNAFLFAWGANNTIGYHGPSNKMSFLYSLRPCFNSQTTAPAAPPSPAAAIPGPNKIMGDCSKVQQMINLGTLQVGFTSVLDNDVGPNGYLNVEVIRSGLGWLSWGYSADGKMVPGFAVVGVPGYAPTEFFMAGKSSDEIHGLPGSQQMIRNQRISQNGTHTILTFSKRLIEDQKLAINGEGQNQFLLAWGDDNNFGYHGFSNRLSFAFTLKACVNGVSSGSPSSETVQVTGSSNHQKLWQAHGFFAAIAWGMLAPVAVGASLLRRVFMSSDLPALWFKIHQALHMTVFVFTTFAFSFAVRAISLTEGVHHFRNVKHRKTGLYIMIMVFVQTMSGLVRPHLPQQKSVNEEQMEPESQESGHGKKSTKRIRWEIGHRLMGFVLLIFSWWQVQDGLKLYSSYFNAKDLSGVFWGITGSLIGIIFIAFLVQFKYC